jgi:hypothetical protein
MHASALTMIGWCGAVSPWDCCAVGRSAVGASKAGQKANAMTAMITTKSALATRVAFHAKPGRMASRLVLTGSSFHHPIRPRD